jgi:hypothetical protein
MWGEHLFGLEENTDDYTDYLAEQINSVRPVDGHTSKFRLFLEDVISEMDKIKDKLDLSTAPATRCPMTISQSQDESQENLLDTLAESKVSHSQYKKITTVFTVLSKTMDDTHQKMHEIFDRLILYGELPDEDSEAGSGAIELMISNMITTLKAIFSQIEHITLLILNVLTQIDALYNAKSKFRGTFKKINFFYPLEIIGKGLKTLLTLDCIIKDTTFYPEPNLKKHWFIFRDAITYLKRDPSKVAVDMEKLRLLDPLFKKIDKGVMDGISLAQFLNYVNDDSRLKSYDEIAGVIELRKNKYVKTMFEKYMNHEMDSFDSKYSAGTDIDVENHLATLVCVFALYKNLFKVEGKEIWVLIWNLQKKTPIIYLHKFVGIRIDDFLNTYAPAPKKYSGLDPKDMNLYLKGLVSDEGDIFRAKVDDHYAKVGQWILKFDTLSTSLLIFSPQPDEGKLKLAIRNQIRLITQGVLLCAHSKNLVQNYV